MENNRPERYRPLYHFTPHSGWMNDPNGLVYYRNEWHLFFQYYNPAETDGMQWGHAVSRDLMHWQHLPPAIPPDANGQIWSGSAVVDHDDSSGLFGGQPGIVCLFTYWDPEDGRQCQGLAFSADGREFTTWKDNPVIPQLRRLEGHPDDKAFRDPKVFYHADTGRWIMAVAGGKLRIFSSANLIDWQFESLHDNIITECPDLFPLAVDGDPCDVRWILSGGGRWYMHGEFDGQRFTPHSEAIPFGAGPDFYATQTWSDAPGGRRIAISWNFDWAYGAGAKAGRIANPFPTGAVAGGAQGIPTELSLASTEAGPRLCQTPVREIESLRADRIAVENVQIPTDQHRRIQGLHEPSFDCEMEAAVPRGAVLEFRLATGEGRYCALGIDNARQMLFIDRTACGLDHVDNYCKRYETPVAPRDGTRLPLRILSDRSMVEIFTGDGRTMMSAFILPEFPISWSVTAAGGDCTIESLKIHTIRL